MSDVEPTESRKQARNRRFRCDPLAHREMAPVLLIGFTALALVLRTRGSVPDER